MLSLSMITPGMWALRSCIRMFKKEFGVAPSKAGLVKHRKGEAWERSKSI